MEKMVKIYRLRQACDFLIPKYGKNIPYTQI